MAHTNETQAETDVERDHQERIKRLGVAVDAAIGELTAADALALLDLAMTSLTITGMLANGSESAWAIRAMIEQFFTDEAECRAAFATFVKGLKA